MFWFLPLRFGEFVPFLCRDRALWSGLARSFCLLERAAEGLEKAEVDLVWKVVCCEGVAGLMGDESSFAFKIWKLPVPALAMASSYLFYA